MQQANAKMSAVCTGAAQALRVYPTENPGRENDRSSKSQGMKMKNMKMKDQIARRVVAQTARSIAWELIPFIALFGGEGC